MIEIYNVLIDEKEIVGVGPLMVKRSLDPVAQQVYNERTYYFEVYAHHYRFTVTTDPLSFNPDYRKQSQQEHESIMQAHKELRKCIIDGRFTGLVVEKTSDIRGYGG